MAIMPEVGESLQSPVPAPLYKEGQKAKGPNGELAVFSNGKWEVKNRTLEDIKNIALPSTVQGLAGLAATPRSLSDAASTGADWLLDKTLGKILPQSVLDRAQEVKDNPELRAKPKIPNPLELWPSHENIMGKVKDVTGRAFDEQAETPIGSAVQTGLELAPSVAAGPSSALRKGGSLLGATAGSQAGGAIGDHFDTEDTNYGGWGRILGAGLGQYAPSILRRGLTPKPVSAQRHADNQRLEDAGIQLRSGQASGPGFLDTLERDNVKWGHPDFKPAGQQAQFGQFAQKEAGVAGPQAAQGLTSTSELNPAMNATGKKVEAGYQAARPKTDKQLTDEMFNTWQNSTPASRKLLEPYFDQVMYRPSPAGASRANKPGKGYLVTPNSTMKGAETRQVIDALTQEGKVLAKQGDVSSAGAMRGLGSDLRGAVDRSLVGTPHEEIPQWREQYTNQTALKGLAKRQGGTPAADMPPMPKDVYDALGKTKNPKAQANNLGQTANLAGQRGVGNPIPWDMSSYGHHPGWTIAGALAGAAGAAHAPAGVDSPILGTLLGGAGAALLRSNPVMARLLLNKGTQNYLKNQRFLPGKHTAPSHKGALLTMSGMPPQEE